LHLAGCNLESYNDAQTYEYQIRVLCVILHGDLYGTQDSSVNRNTVDRTSLCLIQE